jgi:predicted GNAT family acetyltransferase
MELPAPKVVHNAVEGRFEIREGDEVARLDYSVSGDRISLVHTEVPEAFRGRGYAGQLARAGLEYAKGEGLRVVPECSFVRQYIARHPEYAPLVEG